MAGDPPEIVNRNFFVRKTQDCLRYAGQASFPAARIYWLELADRWKQLAEEQPGEQINPEESTGGFGDPKLR